MYIYASMFNQTPQDNRPLQGIPISIISLLNPLHHWNVHHSSPSWFFQNSGAMKIFQKQEYCRSIQEVFGVLPAVILLPCKRWWLKNLRPTENHETPSITSRTIGFVIAAYSRIKAHICLANKIAMKCCSTIKRSSLIPSFIKTHIPKNMFIAQLGASKTAMP